MTTTVHGNLTIADIAVIIGYILGVIVVGIWVCQVSLSLISSMAVLVVNHFSKFTGRSEENTCGSVIFKFSRSG